MKNSEGIALEPSEFKDGLLKRLIFYLVTLLAASIVGHYSAFKSEISFNSEWSIERVVYLATFFGTLFGALGATQPKSALVESKWRDYLSLLGWSVLTVAALLAFLMADSPKSCMHASGV